MVAPVVADDDLCFFVIVIIFMHVSFSLLVTVTAIYC